MRLAALLGLAAAMCAPGQKPDPALPPPAPTGVVYGDADAAPPSTACLMAYQHQFDIECPPAEPEPRAWYAICELLPEARVDCIISAETCLATRTCLESSP